MAGFSQVTVLRFSLRVLAPLNLKPSFILISKGKSRLFPTQVKQEMQSWRLSRVLLFATLFLGQQRLRIRAPPAGALTVSSELVILALVV